MKRPFRTGVFGSTVVRDRRVALKAREVGRELARHDCVVVTGGCVGLPFEAAKGAKETNGNTVAFSPAFNMAGHEKEHGFSLRNFDEVVFVDKSFPYGENPAARKKHRNVLSCAYVDAGTVIGGRIGTMNEFTNLYDMGKHVGILDGSGGITARAISVLLKDAGKPSASKIIRTRNPAALVKKTPRNAEKLKTVNGAFFQKVFNLIFLSSYWCCYGCFYQ